MRRSGKYNAVRAEFAGRMFDSGAERDRAIELTLLVQAGEIDDLQLQPVVELTAGIKFRPDFCYLEGARKRLIFEDVKGIVTREAALKHRLWAVYGPATLRLTRRKGKGQPFLAFREILPKGGA